MTIVHIFSSNILNIAIFYKAMKFMKIKCLSNANVRIQCLRNANLRFIKIHYSSLEHELDHWCPDPGLVP